MKKATGRQIAEVVRQLGSGEIDFDRAQLIIENRSMAEIAEAKSLRERQARRLFDLKIGDVLGCATFEQYLDAVGKDSLEPIPQVPVFPKAQVRLFGMQGIILVDSRVLEKIGLVEYCKLVGLYYEGNDDTFESFEEATVESGVRWMISQDGHRNRNRKPRDCRETFAPFEVGGDVIKGVSIYLQDPTVTKDHCMDLPSSVYQCDRTFVAYLGIIEVRPALGSVWGGYAHVDRGSVSSGKWKSSSI